LSETETKVHHGNFISNQIRVKKPERAGTDPNGLPNWKFWNWEDCELKNKHKTTPPTSYDNMTEAEAQP